MRKPSHPKQWGSARGLSALALLVHLGAISAQEITSFRLVDVEGYLATEMVRDAFTTEGSGTRERQVQSDLRQELSILTHSYVYHPKLVTLDVGAGVVFHRASFTNRLGESSASDLLRSVNARATFLREKPYRGAIHYARSHPSLSVSIGDVVSRSSERYGADLDLLSPLTPVPLHLSVERSRDRADGVLRTLDDEIDRLELRATRSHGAIGATQAQLRASRQRSRSGSPTGPIQTAHLDGLGLSVDSRLQLGARRQHDLTSLVTFDRQTFDILAGQRLDRRDLRGLLDLRTRHTARLESFAHYDFASSRQDDLSSDRHAAGVSISHRPSEDLSTSVGLRADDERATRASTRSLSGDASVRYRRALPIGVGRASYALHYDRRAQRASGTRATVLGERLTLVGTLEVVLGAERVVPTSITVSNVTRSQTYVEGVDYRVSVVGTETRIQRLIAGAILDGDEVLVDYETELGGTFTRDRLDQSLSLGWEVTRDLEIYYRFHQSSPRLVSGVPGFALNHVRTHVVGVRGQRAVDLGLSLVIGGSLEHEDRRETELDLRRDEAEMFVEAELPTALPSNVRVSARQARVRHARAVDDVDLQSVDLRAWTRLGFGLEVSADAGYERDVGGSLVSERRTAGLRARWHYRKFALSLDLTRSAQSQGAFDRDRTLVLLTLRREL
ncbi:MAG: hypothetical protein H6982_15190 [Chromatiales bacterium]|nr:hypothetical protein [Chromatiales bacterium]